MRRFIPLAFAFMGCAGRHVAPSARPTRAIPVVTPESQPVVTTCPDDAAALFATIPFETLSLRGLSRPSWPRVEDYTEGTNRCLALTIDGHRVQLLAAFSADDDVLTNDVIVALFDGGAYQAATVIQGPPGEAAVPPGTCASALGMENAPSLHSLTVEPGAVDRNLLRLEITKDVCGVACGTLSTDVALLSVSATRVTAAFVCRVAQATYVVSNEQAESYGCGEEVERDMTLTVAGSAALRCAQDGLSCRRYDWDGQRFTGPDAPAGVCLD